MDEVARVVCYVDSDLFGGANPFDNSLFDVVYQPNGVTRLIK